MPTVVPGVIVDTANVEVFLFSVNPWQGPLHFGSDLWIPAVNGIGALTTVYWSRSGDGGNTWTQEDTAHGPALNKPFSVAYPWKDQKGPRWYFMNAHSSGTPTQLDIYPFNMSTKLWEPLLTSMTDAGGIKTSVLSDPAGLICQRASQPSFVIFYRKNSTSRYNAQVFDGATWSGAIDGAALTSSYILRSVVPDSTGKMHLLLAKNDNTRMSYATFDHSSTTFSGLSDIIVVGALEGGAVQRSKTPFIYKQSTDELIFALHYTRLGATLKNAFKVIRGTPTAAPVWTPETIDLTAFFPTSDYILRDSYAMMVDPDENYNTLYLVFASHNDTTNSEDKVWYIKNDGSGWTDPVLIWDVSTNPPANFPVDWSDPQTDGIWSGTIDSDGCLLIAVQGLYTLTTPPATVCGIITHISQCFGTQKFWRVREM